MVSLSDKAKGKQKATEPLAEGQGSTSVPLYRELTVRFTDGVPDLLLKIGEKDAVRDVKREVRDSVF